MWSPAVIPIATLPLFFYFLRKMTKEILVLFLKIKSCSNKCVALLIQLTIVIFKKVLAFFVYLTIFINYCLFVLYLGCCSWFRVDCKKNIHFKMWYLKVLLKVHRQHFHQGEMYILNVQLFIMNFLWHNFIIDLVLWISFLRKYNHSVWWKYLFTLKFIANDIDQDYHK